MNPESTSASSQADAKPGVSSGPTPQPDVLKEVQPASAVRLLAVGNAAINVMELLIASGIPAASCVAFNMDAPSLAKSGAAHKLAFESDENPGLGSGGDPVRGASGAEAYKEQITTLCSGARVVILLAGLGGGSGTGAAPMVAQFARGAGATVMAFGIMPFECEGNLRRKIANVGLEDLREAAHMAVVFDNNRALATATEATTLLETFKSANELLAVSVRAAYHAFTGGAVMGLPFSDICTLVRDRSDDCVLMAASSAGQDRVAETSDRLLSHPSLEGPEMLAGADVVSVYVLGGSNLAMLDINRVVDRIGRECGSAPLLMGAAIEPSLEGALLVAVLVGRPAKNRNERRHEELPAALSRCQSPIGDINDSAPGRRPPSRILPPPPDLSPERVLEIRELQTGRKPRKPSQRMRQTQLPLDIVSKGRFDKAEPTIHKGEDLDVPTYVRRGIALN